jgi:hypothetical protein
MTSELGRLTLSLVLAILVLWMSACRSGSIRWWRRQSGGLGGVGSSWPGSFLRLEQQPPRLPSVARIDLAPSRSLHQRVAQLNSISLAEGAAQPEAQRCRTSL